MAEDILKEIESIDIINSTEEELLELFDLDQNFTENDVDESIKELNELINNSNLSQQEKNYIKIFYNYASNKLKQFLQISATNQQTSEFSQTPLSLSSCSKLGYIQKPYQPLHSLKKSFEQKASSIEKFWLYPSHIACDTEDQLCLHPTI